MFDYKEFDEIIGNHNKKLTFNGYMYSMFHLLENRPNIEDFIFKLIKSCEIMEILNYDLLHLAARYSKFCNFKKILELCIEKGYNISAKDSSKRSLLCNVVIYSGISSDINIIEILIEKGCDINENDFHQNNLLHICLQYLRITSNFECFKYLLEKGCDKFYLTKCGNNLIHTATIFNSSETIPFLVEIGLDINKRNNNGKSPLITYFKYVNERYENDIINMMDTNTKDNKGRRAIYDYIKHYNSIKLENIDLLIGYKNVKGVNNKDVNNKGVNNKEGKDNGDIQSIINEKDNKGNNILHNIANWDTLPSSHVILHLLNRGAEVNDTNFAGDTPLHLFVKKQYLNEEYLKLLIDFGSDLNIKDNLGKTAIEILIERMCKDKNIYQIFITRSRHRINKNILLKIKKMVPEFAAKDMDILCKIIEDNNLIKGKCNLCCEKKNIIKCVSSHSICISCIIKDGCFSCPYCMEKYIKIEF